METYKGWICPKCNTVYAPWIPTCGVCSRSYSTLFPEWVDGGTGDSPFEAGHNTCKSDRDLTDKKIKGFFKKPARSEADWLQRAVGEDTDLSDYDS